LPRFNIRADFSLGTEIEVDLGYNAFSEDGTEEFSDESYFSTQSVEADGGSLLFVVEAEDENDAEEQAAQVIGEGGEVEDRNGLTWLIQNVSYDIEVIEVPMTLERAREILTGLVSSGDDEEVREAVEFVFDAFASMDARLSEATARIAGLVARVEQAEGTTQAAS
jgi:hypothetical protein